jgi:response regulator RpfG family c-di-GMP phosphodiesterase
MPEYRLEGWRILVVEDEYLIADDMRDALQDCGAEVLGPVANVDAAASLIAAERLIHGAVLDINLAGTMVFGVADTLVARSIPFIFATGYDHWAIPERFAEVPRLEKPIKARQVCTILGPLMGDLPVK